jgi:hypothetical protein
MLFTVALTLATLFVRIIPGKSDGRLIAFFTHIISNPSDLTFFECLFSTVLMMTVVGGCYLVSWALNGIISVLIAKYHSLGADGVKESSTTPTP